MFGDQPNLDVFDTVGAGSGEPAPADAPPADPTPGDDPFAEIDNGDAAPAAEPEAAPEDAKAPEGQPEAKAAVEKLPDGRVKLPDGTILSQKDLADLLGVQAPAEPAKVDPVQAKIAQLEETIKSLQEAAKPKEAPQQDLIDPLREPEEWMRGFWNQHYQRTGEQLTREQVQQLLGQARDQARDKRMADLERRLEDYNKQGLTAKEEAKIQGEIQKIEASGKYPAAMTEMGKEMLNLIIKDNAAKGITDLEKAYSRVQEMVPLLVMEAYGDKKKANAKVTKLSIPRGGVTKPAPAPGVDGSFDSFDQIANRQKG